MSAYFRNIGVTIASLVDGMRVTLWHFRNKRTLNATLQYPREKWPIPERHIGFEETQYNVIRSRLHVDIDDCIGCLQCERVCPVDCIKIETIKVPKEMELGTIPNSTQPSATSGGTAKKLLVTRFDIDMSECCYCNLCIYPCPEDCIFMVGGPNADKHEIDYEFSVRDRNDLVYEFASATDEEVAGLAQVVGTDDPRAKRRERREAELAKVGPMAEAVDVVTTPEAATEVAAKPKKKAITEPKIDMTALGDIGDRVARGLAKKAAMAAVRAGSEAPAVAEAVKAALEKAEKWDSDFEAALAQLALATIEKPGAELEVAPEPAAEAAPAEAAPAPEAADTAAPAAEEAPKAKAGVDLTVLNGISDRVARGKAKAILNKVNRQGGTPKEAAGEIRATLEGLGKLDSDTEAILAQLALATIEKPGDELEVAPEPAAEAAPPEAAPATEAADTTTPPAQEAPKAKAGVDLTVLNGISDRVARGKAKAILNKVNRQGGTPKEAAGEIRATLEGLGKLDSETEAILAQLEA